MSAFELRDKSANDEIEECVESFQGNSRRLKEECIIALKIYDSCRQQDCCTPSEMGPARAAETTTIGNETIDEGNIIDPPSDAAAVTIDRLEVNRIIIVDKQPSAFKNGFWDIDLKYVFTYRLTFREADGTVIGNIQANSIFNKKLTLFGSTGSGLAISTDLFGLGINADNSTINSEPFVLVEAKAVPLSAELRYPNCRCFDDDDDLFLDQPNEVSVTIGLFSIIKLFRIVDLSVESRGFCVPEECEDVNPLNPCEFFDNLDFPMDIFSPPQRPEFLSGISNNIPRSSRPHRKHEDYDCD